MPKQQTGNTNDGNTALKFFCNAEKSAEITGVNFKLIQRFHAILECINRGFFIDSEKFYEYLKETRHLDIREYSWYSMRVLYSVGIISVHKILFHGKDIIDSRILPIGQHSEEAQEARNKHNRKFRELFTKKTSRIDTNKYLINRLLLTSDPFIANLRSRPKTKRGKISNEVRELLEIRAPAPINQDAVLSESSDLEESDLDSE
ncbi:hypothetical protein AVEN_203137-1 [Araneus ventricosus]|uniref:Uncharacterized protein n=1 Tax=Araneus ventricosus TaxID=182803 RepID=A0A4Y2T6T2_ARAVE|nr:hypothetical protein AVEN_203137-1 [Araneus ventricosus]